MSTRIAPTKEFRFVNLVSEGELVLVTYEGQDITGKRFRNTEAITFRDGKIFGVEVYFGWSIPHEAPEGGFINLQGQLETRAEKPPAYDLLTFD